MVIVAWDSHTVCFHFARMIEAARIARKIAMAAVGFQRILRRRSGTVVVVVVVRNREGRIDPVLWL